MDLFPLSAEWPFQTPNPRVCITSDKAELPRRGVRDGGGGERREGEGKGRGEVGWKGGAGVHKSQEWTKTFLK